MKNLHGILQKNLQDQKICDIIYRVDFHTFMIGEDKTVAGFRKPNLDALCVRKGFMYHDLG